MFGILVKKQMAEIFRGYFYDAKKNKKRSKISTILFMLMYVILMVGVVGGVFTFLAVQLCKPFSLVDMSWLYFLIMGMIAIALGAFGSVFNTFSGLYLSKDNDLLLSMPIPVRSILAARLMGVYLMGLMYSAVVIVPAAVVYWIVDRCYTGWNCGLHSFDPAHFYYCAYFIVCTGMVCGEDKPEIKEQKLRYSVAFFGVFRTLLFGLFQGAGINSGSFAKCFDLWKESKRPGLSSLSVWKSGGR